MRCSSLRSSSRLLGLGLGLGLALACSSADREAAPDTAIESEPPTPASPTQPAEQPHAPIIGAPAPALALDSLSGTRVQLPARDSGRATVLMFGSFS